LFPDVGGNEYKKIDLEEIDKEILALGKRRMVLFLDNNFYGNDRSHFLAKLEIVRHHLDAGEVRLVGERL